MRVVVHRRSGGMALEKLLEQSGVVSLHCPLFPETRGMICASTLLRMKPSAFLLNTSRGPLVVDQDLEDALNAGICFRRWRIWLRWRGDRPGMW